MLSLYVRWFDLVVLACQDEDGYVYRLGGVRDILRDSAERPLVAWGAVASQAVAYDGIPDGSFQCGGGQGVVESLLDGLWQVVGVREELLVLGGHRGRRLRWRGGQQREPCQSGGVP